MISLTFHPEAQFEYEAALAWYGERSLRAAERFEAEVDRVLHSVAAHPEWFAHYDAEHRFAVLRRYPYSIIFEQHLERIHVVAVAHSARSPGYWQERI